MNRASPRRRAGAGPACLVTALALGACGQTSAPSASSEAPNASPAAAYRDRCESQCELSGGGDTCEAYCRCELRAIERRGHLPRVLELLREGREGRVVEEPWFGDVYAACGAMHGDHTFVSDCEGGCPSRGPTCAAFCACCLDEVRRGRSREEGTRWLFEEYAHDPPSASAVARIDAARAACATRLGMPVGVPPGAAPSP